MRWCLQLFSPPYLDLSRAPGFVPRYRERLKARSFVIPARIQRSDDAATVPGLTLAGLTSAEVLAEKNRPEEQRSANHGAGS